MRVAEYRIPLFADFFDDDAFQELRNRPTFSNWITNVFTDALEIGIQFLKPLRNIHNFADAVLQQ